LCIGGDFTTIVPPAIEVKTFVRPIMAEQTMIPFLGVQEEAPAFGKFESVTNSGDEKIHLVFFLKNGMFGRKMVGPIFAIQNGEKISVSEEILFQQFI